MTDLTGAHRILGVSLKMYLDHMQQLEWSRRVRQIMAEHPAVASGEVGIFVLPTFPALVQVQEILGDTRIQLGAQDIAWADSGPFTGEVSGIQLAQVGCRLAEIGHAERRRYFREDADIFARKVIAAYRNGLLPVLCIGEAESVTPKVASPTCAAQLEEILEKTLASGEAGRLIIAYEPEWAIGAAAPAPVGHVLEVVDTLRLTLDKYREVEGSRIIYGGSAGTGLLPHITPQVDGLFLGRTTHDIAVFRAVLEEAVATLE